MWNTSDGKTILAGGQDGRLRLWDAASGTLTATIGGQLDVYNVNATASSPYGLTTTMFVSNTSSSAGLDPQDFVNLGNEAYFVGQDANNNATRK